MEGGRALLRPKLILYSRILFFDRTSSCSSCFVLLCSDCSANVETKHKTSVGEDSSLTALIRNFSPL